MTRRGLLLTMTEPPPAIEDEFNAWYESEHLPERLAITGFRSARRWVADVAPGEGKYLATYELESAAVLASPQYLSFFEKPTAWTRRCLGKAVVFRRWACEQITPGHADCHPAAKALLLLCSDQALPEFGLAGALQTRRFLASAGEPRHVVLVESGRDGAHSLPALPSGVLAREYHALS